MSSRSATRTETRLVMRDPYSFAPTLGELDLHLAREGRHEDSTSASARTPREIDGRRARRSRCGLRMPRRSACSATSTCGTGGAPDALAGRVGHLGAVRPRAAEGARYKFELRHAAASGAQRPIRSPSASSCRRAPPPRSPPPTTPGATNSGSSVARAPPPRASRSRSTSSTSARGGEARTARRSATASSPSAGPLRPRARLHPCRAAACDGAPVRGLVGLPGRPPISLLIRASAHPMSCARSSISCTASASA